MTTGRALTRSHRRKATPSHRVTSVDTVIALLRIGHYLYVGDRLYHPKWLVHWSLALLAQRVQFGGVFMATRCDDTRRFYVVEPWEVPKI